MSAAVELPTGVSSSDAWRIKIRAAGSTLLMLLAINGILPILGHSPAGIWSAAVAADQPQPTVTAPAQVPTTEPAPVKTEEEKPGK